MIETINAMLGELEVLERSPIIEVSVNAETASTHLRFVRECLVEALRFQQQANGQQSLVVA